MISSFTKFNEGLTSDIDKLKSDADDAFAYISDENKVSTYIRESEVYVDILSILPNNVIYDNIEEYINKHEIWHEVLLDINVAIEQLTSKGNVGVVLNINTVGNVKIKFHLIHNKIMKTDKTKIEISVINLTKALIEEGLEAPDAPASTNFSMREENLYCIKFYSKPNMDVREVQSKITKIFSNEGLSKSSFQVRSEIYYYDGNISNSVCFSVPKVDSSGRLLKTFKRVKLKRQI